MLLSSDSDTNALSASFGIALSFMSSRIHSSLCSSPPLSTDAISSTPFGWSSTYSQFDCTIIKWNDDLNLPIKIRTDTLRKVLNSTYDHARPTSTLDVENSSSTISADWQPARGLPAVNSNRNHSGNNGLKICFQNISGMRTKTQSVFMNTSQSDYDIIILVVRMNSSIRNYSVFRRDRDFGRMNIPN